MSSVKYRIIEVTYFNGDKKYVVEENIGGLLSEFNYTTKYFEKLFKQYFNTKYDTIKEAEKCIEK